MTRSSLTSSGKCFCRQRSCCATSSGSPLRVELDPSLTFCSQASTISVSGSLKRSSLGAEARSTSSTMRLRHSSRKVPLCFPALCLMIVVRSVVCMIFESRKSRYRESDRMSSAISLDPRMATILYRCCASTSLLSRTSLNRDTFCSTSSASISERRLTWSLMVSFLGRAPRGPVRVLRPERQAPFFSLKTSTAQGLPFWSLPEMNDTSSSGASQKVL
mmetsp:Transcript_170752/g.414903  ORF Transcript_170752/g.414903 Transcript_170752/m.414903 type:complete len:218 (-) Transcript_170752:139-792(-)